MRIGIDIHGVLSDKERALPIIMNFKERGHELYVVSGAPVIDQMIELKTMYKYDLSLFSGFYSIAEHLYSSKKVSNYWKDDRDRWWFEPASAWWRSKSEICEKYELDLLIDDEPNYQQGYLSNKFWLYQYLVENNIPNVPCLLHDRLQECLNG